MVPAEFDAAVEVERRVGFLAEQLADSGGALGVRGGCAAAVGVGRGVGFLGERLADGGLRVWVRGISGGVAPAPAGRLCQPPAGRVRGEGGPAAFVAIRLPYHAQAD